MAAVLLSVVMADAVVDWALLRSRIDMLGSWRQASVLAGLVLAWAIVAGRALRPVWRLRTLGFLVRQPLGYWQWASFVYPALCPALIVVLGIAWLVPQQVHWLLHYVGILGLASPIVLGASFRRWDFMRVVAIGTFVFFVFLLAYSTYPATALLAFPLIAVAMPYSVEPVRRQIVSVERRANRRLSRTGIVAAIMWRDLLYLSRKQIRRLLGLASLVAFCASMMLAFRINGEQAGRDALLSACLFFTVSVTTVFEILEALKTGMGKELARRRWPITRSQRILALIALVSVLVGPGAVTILIMASSMGIANVVAYMLFVGVTVSVSVGLFSRSLTSQSSANGTYLLFLVSHMILLLALDQFGYVLLSAAILPLGAWLALQGIERFTVIVERVSDGQPA